MNSRRQVLENLKAQDYASANAGLWLDKFFDGPEAKPKEEKHTLVRQVATIAVSKEYIAFFGRWEQTLKDCEAISRQVEVRGRMAVGLGADSVLETSITLHRTYGVPYIPATALKGLVRRYAMKYLQKKDDTGEWKEEHTDKLFGTTDKAGYITFFDALYVPGSGHNQCPLHPDVMTVHHPEYYQSSGGKIKPPADWDDPTPIPFLSATGEYLVAVAAPYAKEWREVTLTILEHALREEGIGGKTSSGYGRLSVDSQKRPQAHSVDMTITATSKKIPAEVVDNSSNPITVRLLVNGYENRSFKLSGITNLSSFPKRTLILVDVVDFDKKTKNIRMLGNAALLR